MSKLLLAAAVLLLSTNAVVLSGVAYNRAGEPFVSIDLTERELTITQSYRRTDENSGTAVSLQWQVPGADGEPPARRYARLGSPAWLDEAKLSGLGFDLTALKNDNEHYRRKGRLLTREVVLVLEYNGDAYRQALSSAQDKVSRFREKLAKSPDDEDRAKKLEHYEKWLTRLKVSQTRLYVVDAGFDKQALAEKYADGNKYLFMRGDIGLRWNDGAVTGQIRRVHVRQVHVPLPYSKQLAELAQGRRFNAHNKDPIPPRYRVRINIGKRLEPWIAAVAPIAGENQGE